MTRAIKYENLFNWYGKTEAKSSNINSLSDASSFQSSSEEGNDCGKEFFLSLDLFIRGVFMDEANPDSKFVHKLDSAYECLRNHYLKRTKADVGYGDLALLSQRLKTPKISRPIITSQKIGKRYVLPKGLIQIEFLSNQYLSRTVSNLF